METIKAINKRRSIRSFKKEDIDRETIETIIDAGRLAPSAKNRQPWYFVVVKNEIKDKIVDIMVNYCNNSEKSKFNGSVRATAKAIKEAPILVLIFREKDNVWNIGDSLSIGACIQNMCLRATDLGLGSLWIRDIVFVLDEITELVGHSEMELNSALSIGYAKELPNPRPRKKLDEIIEWFE